MKIILAFPHPHSDSESVETVDDFLKLFESEVQRVLPLIRNDLQDRCEEKLKHLEPPSLFRNLSFRFVVTGYETLVFMEDE